MYNEEYEPRKKSKGARIAGGIIKFIIAALMLIVWVAIFARMCTSGDPESASEYIWSEAALELAASGSELEVITQPHVNTLDIEGRFQVNNSRITESLSQFQITVRYNNSTVTRMAEELELAEFPTGEVYVYTLEASDGTVYTDYSFDIDTKTVYNFRRLLFDGVKLTDSQGDPITTLTLKIYYIDDMNPDSPYSTFTVYDRSREIREVELEGAPETANELYDRPAYIVKEAE